MNFLKITPEEELEILKTHWWDYGEIWMKRTGPNGFTSEEAEKIASQLEEHVQMSKKSGKYQHVIVNSIKKRFYVHVDSSGQVRVPSPIPSLYGQKKKPIKTLDNSKILSFQTHEDW